jgi:CHAT domain-containing protein/Tfp pilus assembly protein PilF
LYQGRFADAEPLYKRAVEISERSLGPDHPQVAASLNNLATLYVDQGRYVDAEQLFKQVLAMRERAFGPDHPQVAGSLSNLATLYRELNRNADAEPLFKRALEISERALGSDHPNITQSLTNLATLYVEQGRYADAEPLYKRSLAISEKTLGPDHPDVGQPLNNLAVLYKKQGRYADAELFLKRALTIAEQALGPDHPDVAVPLTNLAALYLAQSRYADAEPLFKRSLAIREKAFGTNHPDVAFSLNNLAELYVVERRYGDALPLVRAAAQIGAQRKSIYLTALTGASAKTLITNADAFNEGYQVVQRAASSAASQAVNQLSVRFAAGNDRLAELVRRDQDLSSETERFDKLIIEAASKEPSKRDAAKEQEIRARLRLIASERAQIETTLYQRFPDYAALAKPAPLSVQETQQLLADDEILIVFDFDRQSYAGVFSHSQAGSFVLQITAADLEAQVKALRVSLTYAPQFDVEASYRLYQSLFGPYAEYIASKTRLTVVANGALTSFPLQLLVTKDPTGKKLTDIDWLVRKYAITVVPSTASLKILRKIKNLVAPAKPMIGFGDPVFDTAVQSTTKPTLASLDRGLPAFYRGTTLTPLPDTADELRAIAKELGAGADDIKLGEAASVPNVKHARLDNYQVVYFATHALVAGDVEKFAKAKAEPALVLSIPERPSDEDDGLLRASDVAMLKLNADLVVLSACNTAAGDKPGAEALSGLARAFFYAGARSLIVSNWDVDSESTVALMTGLFDALKNNPHLTHAEALRLSMLQMIDRPANPNWRQPKFWAPFVVVGEPQRK